MAGIGYIALLLALVASVYSAIAFIFGVKKRLPTLIRTAKYGGLAVFGLVSLSVIILLYALLIPDFQIEYVASHTSSELPLLYRFSALWAGNAGSILVWAWLLSLFAVVATLRKQDDNGKLLPFASAFTMLIEAFFLLLLVYTCNPFAKLSFIPEEGAGLNPLLQHPAMVFHPPLLLAGYASFAIPFAFTMAALLTKELGQEWITAVRRYALLAWLLLGLGNLSGAWWAYAVLGWGGYWAWDPVENAGLMPWLVVTAFLHSSTAQRKGMFKVWNMLLIIFAFFFIIFGAFLTRSGIVHSVHAFAESIQGPFFLAFMLITLVGSLYLVYYRRHELRSEVKIDSLLSKESFFLLTSLLLIVATYAVFFGTIFPAISQITQGIRVSVREAFFNQVTGPIFLIIILLMGICVFVGRQLVLSKSGVSKFLPPLLVALIVGVSLFLGGISKGYALLGFVVCGFVTSAIIYKWFLEVRARHYGKEENYLRAFWQLLGANRQHYGGYIVHLAIVLITIGVIGSSFYQVEKQVSLVPGESIAVKNYNLTYEGMKIAGTPNRMVFTAALSVDKGGTVIQLAPQVFFQQGWEQRFAEVAIHSTLLEDLYVVLAGWTRDGKATFHISVKPLLIWLWIGGSVLLLGGLLCLTANRS